MDHLWAPWRLSYIAGPKEKPAGGNPCFICRGLEEGASADRANHLVLRAEHSVVYLNRFPYNNGHLLVCPRAHKGRLEELTTEEVLDIQLLIRRLVGILEKRMNAEGFNVGLNIGRVSGAGVPGHLHWHVVPRWAADANFMSVTANTKVISQSLDALYDLVTEELSR